MTKMFVNKQPKNLIKTSSNRESFELSEKFFITRLGYLTTEIFIFKVWELEIHGNTPDFAIFSNFYSISYVLNQYFVTSKLKIFART